MVDSVSSVVPLMTVMAGGPAGSGQADPAFLDLLQSLRGLAGGNGAGLSGAGLSEAGLAGALAHLGLLAGGERGELGIAGEGEPAADLSLADGAGEDGDACPLTMEMLLSLLTGAASPTQPAQAAQDGMDAPAGGGERGQSEAVGGLVGVGSAIPGLGMPAAATLGTGEGVPGGAGAPGQPGAGVIAGGEPAVAAGSQTKAPQTAEGAVVGDALAASAGTEAGAAGASQSFPSVSGGPVIAGDAPAGRSHQPTSDRAAGMGEGVEVHLAGEPGAGGSAARKASLRTAIEDDGAGLSAEGQARTDGSASGQALTSVSRSMGGEGSPSHGYNAHQDSSPHSYDMVGAASGTGQTADVAGAASTSPTTGGAEAAVARASVVEQVARRASLAAARGRSGLSIQLEPRDLGKVQVHVTLGADGLRVGLSAELLGTREMLQASLPELRAAFEGQGITVDRLDLGHDFGSGFEGFGTPGGNPQQRHELGGIPADSSYWRGEEDSAGSAEPQRVVSRESLVDYRI